MNSCRYGWKAPIRTNPNRYAAGVFGAFVAQSHAHGAVLVALFGFFRFEPLACGNGVYRKRAIGPGVFTSHS